MSLDYTYSDVGVPLYERPCGCSWPGSHSLATGVRFYRRRSMGMSEVDVNECLMCGAVWRMKDAVLDNLDAVMRHVRKEPTDGE